MGNNKGNHLAFRDLIHLLYSVEYNQRKSMISKGKPEFDRMLALSEMISHDDNEHIDTPALREWFKARQACDSAPFPIIDTCKGGGALGRSHVNSF
ncbi:Hypothetical protein UVM_LOCUS411 [uncultured virus]|nr:Hypothetical protein UVM_LOCUS411 [uncultured virus]